MQSCEVRESAVNGEFCKEGGRGASSPAMHAQCDIPSFLPCLFAEGRVVFRTFLRCEYSEENILFWLACEDLKKERSPELIEEKVCRHSLFQFKVI